jgi:3-phosphoshikimate 1-carboxyvinyltransferase
LNASGRTLINAPGPSRDHTERLLKAMGAQLVCDGDNVTLEGPVDLRAVDIEVPGDFSSAAFFLVAGCLAAPNGLVIRNVGLNPSRTGLLSILELMGAKIVLHRERMVGGEPVADLEATRSSLSGAAIPPSLVPLAIDEFPIVFAAAAVAKGVTHVTGAAELRHKESDRIGVMAEGLRQLGIRVEEHPDGASIYGGELCAGEVDSAGDHRVAMAFAVAGQVAAGPIDIHDTANVATSFPGFDALAGDVGFQLEVLGG